MKLHPLSISTPAHAPSALANATSAGSQRVDEVRELKQVFSQFVGESFYGMMLKSMRRTLGEPAYFHGGQAEEMFRSRLDQQVAEDLAGSPNNNLADSLFESQFPQHAQTLRAAQSGGGVSGNPLASLDALRRR